MTTPPAVELSLISAAIWAAFGQPVHLTPVTSSISKTLLSADGSWLRGNSHCCVVNQTFNQFHINRREAFLATHHNINYRRKQKTFLHNFKFTFLFLNKRLALLVLFLLVLSTFLFVFLFYQTYETLLCLV